MNRLFLTFLTFCFLIVFASEGRATSIRKKLALQNLVIKEKVNYELFGAPREKVRVVFFWASWCKYCKELAREIDSINKTNGDLFEIVGISVDEKKRVAQRMARTTFRNFKNMYWLSPKGAKKMNISKLPLVLIVDKNGLIDTIYEGSETDKITYLKKRLSSLESKSRSDLDAM
jgi:thiol-disulfide isomerase/thioredoxin